MKIRMIAGLLAPAMLAGVAMPAVVLAQDVSAETQIVVTGPYKALWTKGNVQERKGIEALKKAQDKLSDANRQIEQAANKQTSGSGTSSNASAEFRQLTSSTPDFDKADDAVNWGKNVTKAAERWKKAEGTRRDGVNDLDNARKKQGDAERDIAKAEAQISAGRATMAEAQLRANAN